jgi:hypothetical protein
MGAGFYMMIAVSVVMYKIAMADGKKAWMWFSVNLLVAMVFGKLYGLGVLVAVSGGVMTLFLMFLFNVLFTHDSK